MLISVQLNGKAFLLSVDKTIKERRLCSGDLPARWRCCCTRPFDTFSRFRLGRNEGIVIATRSECVSWRETCHWEGGRRLPLRCLEMSLDLLDGGGGGASLANLGLAIWAQTRSYRDSSGIARWFGVLRVSVKLHARPWLSGSKTNGRRGVQATKLSLAGGQSQVKEISMLRETEHKQCL